MYPNISVTLMKIDQASENLLPNEIIPKILDSFHVDKSILRVVTLKNIYI